jgi:predicted Zn finger-like uncharacterized protein
MITRCPECATAFRITYEQIEVREGRVRCGHCGEVFDALAAMESVDQDARDELHSGEPDAPALERDADLAGGENAPRSTGEPSTPDADQAAAPIAPGESPPATRPRSDEAAPLAQPEPREDAAPRSMVSSSNHAGARPVPASASLAAEELASEFAFEQARTWRPWWAAAAAVLLVALNLQAVFYFRGAIALVWPAAKPYIARFCARFGCEVPLPRRAELMSIETSDLQADPANPGVMVLSATLRNRAAFPQAYPALELTLTNERDEPLARRVLGPPDYLGPATQKHAEQGLASCMGGVPSCELPVKVLFEAASLKASGYRLYLFYP